MNHKIHLSVWLLAVLVLVLKPVSSFAEDYITEAVRELQKSGTKVYIHPDAEYTDINTSSRLQNYFRPDDTIVLVMLPVEAMADTSPESLARQLSEKLNDNSIVGLAVGKEVAAYAPLLPDGVAADQMRRAESVSNDPVTALGTFVQNIHLWLSEHPQPTPLPTATPIPTPITSADSGEAIGGQWTTQLLLVSFPVLAVLFSLLAIRTRRVKKQYGNMGAELRKQVDQDLAESQESLTTIRDLIDEVTNPRVRNVLEEAYSIASREIVEEVEAEPQRATPVTILQIKQDLATFSDILKLYTQLLSKHLNEGALPAGFRDSLEDEFFPNVRDVFQKIAIELDKGDIRALENLVNELNAQFKARGLE